MSADKLLLCLKCSCHWWRQSTKSQNITLPLGQQWVQLLHPVMSLIFLYGCCCCRVSGLQSDRKTSFRILINIAAVHMFANLFSVVPAQTSVLYSYLSANATLWAADLDITTVFLYVGRFFLTNEKGKHQEMRETIIRLYRCLLGPGSRQ